MPLHDSSTQKGQMLSDNVIVEKYIVVPEAKQNDSRSDFHRRRNSRSGVSLAVV